MDFMNVDYYLLISYANTMTLSCALNIERLVGGLFQHKINFF